MQQQIEKMYRVEVHSKVELIISLFYKLGLWQRNRAATTKEMLLKWSYSIGFFSTIISFSVGACNSDNVEDGIFLAQSAIAAIVLLVKLNFVIWRSAKILDLLREVCVYTTDDRKSFTLVSDQLKRFTTFTTTVVWISSFTCIYAVIISPFIGNRRALFFDIAFPLDHKNDEMGFWIAFTYLILFALIPSVTAMAFNVLMWYLLFSCALRYKVLERRIANIGHKSLEQNISVIGLNHLYEEGIMDAITIHANTKKIASELESFFSRIFITSFVTSGAGICGSLYCLIAFHRSTNVSGQFVLLAILLYSVFDVHMLTYFGNEIKLSSDHFIYCLFESDWIGKPKSIIRSVLIFGELLMRPHEIFVFKLYPLSFETFTRILRSAYNMFNILQNLQ